MPTTAQILHLRIPKELPEALVQPQERKLLRPVLALIHLKALYKHGRFTDNAQGRATAAAQLRISVKQFGRYLTALQAEGLVNRPGNNAIQFASWTDIALRFKCSATKYHLVPVMERERGYKQPEKWRTTNAIDFLILKNKVNECQRAYFYKLSRVPGLEDEIKQAAGSLSPEAILRAQIECFKTEGQSCDYDYRYQLMLNRADFAVGVNRYGKLFGLTPQAISYKKKKLAALGLLTIEKRQIELEGHRTRQSRVTDLGQVPYSRKARKPVLNMPDRLEFFSLSFSFNQTVEKQKAKTDA